MDALKIEISSLVGQGYRVLSATETSAQLVKPKSFSFGWATLWFLLFGAGVLVYLFQYWSRTDDVVYLYIAEDGSVVTVRPSPEASTVSKDGRTPWGLADMAFAIAIVIVLTILISIPAALAADQIAGKKDIEDDPTALAIVLGISIVLEALMFWTAYRFSVQKYNLSREALGLRMPSRGGWLFPIGLMIGGFAVMYVYFGALAAFGVSPETDLPEGVFDDARPFLVLFLLSVFVAPVVEEIFFRGFIFGGLRGRWGTLIAAIASGALFGLAHIGNPGTIYILPPIAAVGAIFAFGYVYTGSIVPSIVAHFLFNFLQVTLGLAFS